MCFFPGLFLNVAIRAFVTCFGDIKSKIGFLLCPLQSTKDRIPTSEGVVAVVHLLLEVPQPRDDEDEAEDLEADVGGEHADVAAGVEEEGAEGQRHQVGQVVEKAEHGQPHKPVPEHNRILYFL